MILSFLKLFIKNRMAENAERSEEIIDFSPQSETGPALSVLSVLSHLKLATVFMDPHQRRWLVEGIVFFNKQSHSNIIRTFLEAFGVLDKRHIDKIMECLVDGKCRTELVRLMSEKGFQ